MRSTAWFFEDFFPGDFYLVDQRCVESLLDVQHVVQVRGGASCGCKGCLDDFFLPELVDAGRDFFCIDCLVGEELEFQRVFFLLDALVKVFDICCEVLIKTYRYLRQNR